MLKIKHKWQTCSKEIWLKVWSKVIVSNLWYLDQHQYRKFWDSNSPFCWQGMAVKECDAWNQWNLPSLPTAATDNAANEIKTFKYLQWTRFECLAVKKAISIRELSNMLAKGKRRVTYYHQSSSATDVLKGKQLLLFDLTTLKLIQDVPTRWNSTLDM